MILNIMKILKNSFIILILLSSQLNAEFKTITKKEFLDKNIKILEKRFNQIDINKDKKLDPNEQKAWANKVMKARQDQVNKIRKKRAELAKKIDTNKDGKLSKKEIDEFKKKQKSKK